MMFAVVAQPKHAHHTLSCCHNEGQMLCLIHTDTLSLQQWLHLYLYWIILQTIFYFVSHCSKCSVLAVIGGHNWQHLNLTYSLILKQYKTTGVWVGEPAEELSTWTISGFPYVVVDMISKYNLNKLPSHATCSDVTP